MHVNIDGANSYYSIGNSPCVQAILYIINQMQSNWPLSSIIGQYLYPCIFSIRWPMPVWSPRSFAKSVASVPKSNCKRVHLLQLQQNTWLSGGIIDDAPP